MNHPLEFVPQNLRKPLFYFFGSLGIRVAMPYMVVLRLSKPAIAFDIKI